MRHFFTVFIVLIILCALISCERVEKIDIVPEMIVGCDIFTPEIQGYFETPHYAVFAFVYYVTGGHLGYAQSELPLEIHETTFGGYPVYNASEVGPRALRLRFIVEDDESTEAGAIAAVQKLVDRDVPVIVGIAISDYLEDAFPIAQAAGVIAFSPTSSAAGLSSIGNYVFRAGLATNILIPRGVAVTQQKLGYTQVALIYDADDTYSVSSNTELKKALEANGVAVVMEQTFQTHDTDFRSQLTAIKDASVDALFISALAPEMSQIIVQGRVVGISAAVHYIIPELSNAVVQTAGAALDSAYSPVERAITFASWDAAANTPGNTAFVQNYRARYDEEPEPWAAQSYATLYILADAIAKAHSTDADAIRDALAQTQDFPSILGDFSFDPNGEALYGPIVLIVEDGGLQVFE